MENIFRIKDHLCHAGGMVISGVYTVPSLCDKTTRLGNSSSTHTVLNSTVFVVYMIEQLLSVLLG